MVNDEDDEVEDSEPEREAERPGAWKAEVHFTNANYHAKKTTFLLFINRRSSFPALSSFRSCQFRPARGFTENEAINRGSLYWRLTEGNFSFCLPQVCG